MRRYSSLVFLSALALAGLAGTGCAPQTSLPFTAEVDDPDYRRGKELMRMGREPEALKQFLKVIDQRGGAAAESHLDAAILYHRHIKDPISAIYHYRRYREMRPNTEQARLALQSIEACIRDFARNLPAQPMDNQVDRTSMMDAVDRLQRENLQLKEQLAAARAAILDTTRQASVGLSEPSQGGFAIDPPEVSRVTAAPRAPVPEYSAPVGVSPIQVAPAPAVQAAPPPTAPAVPPISTAGMRRHIVQKGDTLQSISLRYYGTRSRFRDIYAANRDVMPNEGTLRIGMELRIPQ
jgi:phage tail protein X